MTETAVGFDVTVVVAVRNGARTLAQCLASVRAQRGCTIELIVVDALSEDGTADIVGSFTDSVSLSIREADSGIADAWNKALRHARGDWIIFLGADDYLLGPESIASLLACARESLEGPVLVFGGLTRVGGIQDFVAHPDPDDVRGYVRNGKMLPHPAMLHSTAALRAIGGFNESFRIAADLEAVVRLVDRGLTVRCDHVVTAMRVGGVSNEWESFALAAKEVRRIVRATEGFFAAEARYLQTRSLQRVGYAVEALLQWLLGDVHGTRAILRLRRRLGRPPKLLRPSADGESGAQH